MSLVHSPTSAPVATRPWWRPVPRWLLSFLGFPLGGVAAMALTGPVDSLAAALGGGLVSGAVLGAVQAWALGDSRPRFLAWVLATALGLMVGLGIGAALVAYGTGLADLVVQGLVCGACVGVAQAVVLRRRLGAIAFTWPVLLAGIWAIGWAVTTSVGVRVDDQFTVFGSTGALTVTLLTAVLPVLLHRTRTEKSTS